MVCRRCDDSANSEEKERRYKELGSSKYVGKGCNERLDDSVGEKVGCTDPKCIGSRSMEVSSDCLEIF